MLQDAIVRELNRNRSALGFRRTSAPGLGPHPRRDTALEMGAAAAA
jgi:hypothetical protein